MTVLNDYQFEILPDAEANDGVVFGIGADISLNDGGFDPGENEWQTQDQTNSRRGVRAFGRDVLGPKTWVWESHTNRTTAEEAVATLETFSAAWTPELLALGPGEMTAVRYRLAGRDRRVFGRPRRYSAPPTNLILSGMVPVTHDFACVDAFTYDDVESQALILYSSSAEGGGFTFPLTFPVTTLPSEGSGSDQLSVSGNARTYPIVRFNGPWSNPRLNTGDWAISWVGDIGAGSWVEIDCRPWALTVKNQSGASVVGSLERTSNFEDLWFAPQSNPQIALSGSATGGSASALIRWRNAWTSI